MPLFSVFGNIHIWSHLLKKSLMENFIFCAVKRFNFQYIETEVKSVNDRVNISMLSVKIPFFGK